MDPNICATPKQMSGGFIRAGAGKISYVTAIWGTGPNYIRIYDGVDVGGILLFEAKRAALAATGDETQHFEFPEGLRCSTGIFVDFPVGPGMANADVGYTVG